MFGTKKNNLPPRPCPPIAAQILEDLNASEDDIVFKLGHKEPYRKESAHQTTSDIDSVYERLRTYLEVKEKLKELGEAAQMQKQLLLSSDLDMQQVADRIRRQAQEALTKQ